MSTTLPHLPTDDVPPTDPPTGATAPRRRWALLVGAVVAAVAMLGVVLAVLLVGRDGGGAAEVPDTDRDVDVRDLGAVGDGRTDDTEALQEAFDTAEPGTRLVLPEGMVFTHDDVLTLGSPDVVLSGGGTLLATDEERSSLVLAADRVAVQDLTLTIEDTSRRFDAYEQQRLRLDGHTGIVVSDVRVEGSAAAGVYVGGGTADFLLDSVQVSGTEADGIHITQGAHDGRVLQPVVRDVGDDGVAVVSYAPDGAPCARIEVVSPTVDGSSGGRGVSVVGGEDVTFSDIDVRNTYAAGVYVAAEGSFDTTGVSGVLVDGGTVDGANTGEDIDHGAILVFNGTDDETVDDVVVRGLEVTGTRTSASREVGLVTDREDGITGVVLEDISLEEGGPERPMVSSSASTTYETRGWTIGGEDVPDLKDTEVGTDDD